MFWFTKLSPERRRTIGHWLMELVIVVAGVLIALWLQQWGERRRAIADMNAAEDAIHDEVVSSLNELVWRQAISKCHFDRAVLLKDMLLKFGNQWPGIQENAITENSIFDATGVQVAVPSVYQRPSDSYSMAAWTSALATGALAPMDHKRFGKLVSLYNQIALLGDARAREDRAAATLSALAFPQQMTPETRTRMLEALYEIDRSRFVFGLAVKSDFVRDMRALGWNDLEAVAKQIAEDRADTGRLGLKFRPCVADAKNPFAEAPAKD